ncbi:hypothetical protein BC826DRAFT_1093972 [Russula brevipes]|nr:hypothetical protein BC826DRAFT_1093972 [Russula brevipes]
MPKTPRLPCLHRYCPLTFKSQHGRTYHIRSAHGTSNEHLFKMGNGEVFANDEANSEDSSSANDEANAATGEDSANNEANGDTDDAVDMVNDRADCDGAPSNTGQAGGQRIEHPYLTALPCDTEGNYLPHGTPPPPRETVPAVQGDWTPFDSELQFKVADVFYRRAAMSASNIDAILELWAETATLLGADAPFESHEHLYKTIDSSTVGNVPWECLVTSPPQTDNSNSPAVGWMKKSYEVWYRDPDAVVSMMLENADFDGQFDLRPYVELDSSGKRRWNNVMSGNIAWRRCDNIIADNPSLEGSMYCPIILGCDKTTVTVSTGHVEYHPLYLSIGNPHNSVRRAHRNAVIPIAFMATPKCDRRDDDSAAFRLFKHKLYHSSIAAILRPLHAGMTCPVIRKCPDGHLRRVLYDLIAFIADYPEQVLVTGIVQGWCPKCTALPGELDVPSGRRTPAHTDMLCQILDAKSLWREYGIDGALVPFTSDYPRGDIYEMISPDLLHQLIKGTFKDHLVTWICRYIILTFGERQGNIILDDIDRRIAAVPPFPGLRRFPHGRRFKQWTGDDSKALMKVYIPAIVGYVPEEIVKCLSALLDASYIARRQDIDCDALDALDVALDKFRTLREIFRSSGVRPKGFSVPRQHALFHYRRLIEDFGAPGGLCSSITESRHITAVKKPWRRSNKFEALRLDKLAAMRSDFVARGMLPASHTAGRNVSCLPEARESAECADRRYPRYIDDIAKVIDEPDLHYATQEFLADHLKASSEDICLSATPISRRERIHGMRRERIRSTPSWRNGQARRDCAFVVDDQEKAGMSGLRVVRVLLFFEVEYDRESYPCAFVEWFENVGCDSATGLWIVRPDCTDGSRDKSVLHLDTFLRAAHLIPVYGDQEIPLDFHFSYTLDSFQAYYVNKYIDHHAFEIAF